MNAADANEYIGRPWVSGGRGPDAFDCWGLLRWVQARHFGTELPDIPDEAAATRALYHAQISSGAWRVLSRPAHGSGVLLRDGDRPHVGVYLGLDGGGVLHALDGVGVIFTLRSQLRSVGYPRVTWYEFIPRNDCPRG
ncbi:C40 family peptidase [Burkholderia plantarii]|uniref:NlpC/P60 family protein n=1 Tax=Burkholderia plantarii TaxID=41899 RepID=UPI00272CD5D6|nr:NlpC/P60 family protein [Burkholderia plantarii]WLE60229.1 C40 family peptidase [Burkholderia plantarii]